MQNTKDIFYTFLNKFNKNEFRTIGNEVQQSKTLEIQNAHFEVDKPWIVRAPNYDYYTREKQWYISQSLNVNDIPGETPKMWKACATLDGFINSNYGWCIYSKENDNQFDNCRQHLLDDPHTREAIMIYNRPSMQQDYNKDGMHDFMCCQNVQYFINEKDDKTDVVDCIVNFRSSDAIFGFNNDALWEYDVLADLVKSLQNDYLAKYNKSIDVGKMFWNAGSLHIYERHFSILSNETTKQNVDNWYKLNI